MFIRAFAAIAAFAVSAAPVLADDCSAARSAILNSGHTPKSTATTKTDHQGKQVVTRQIQTLTNKYVQTADGKWYAMNIALKDLDDDKDAKLTCHGAGSDSVKGEFAAVFEVHVENEGAVSDNKMWVSSKNLILKSEAVIEGAHYTTEYDYAHFSPPADAISMGGK